MNKIDLIILGIILIFMLVGYYKGLVKVVLSLVQYIVVLVLSVLWAPKLAEVLIDKFGIDSLIINWVINNESLFSDTLTFISNDILQNIVGRIINILAIIILFIVLKIVCAIIICILNKFANLPIISVANRLGGLALGALEGVLVVYFLMLILNWLPFSSLAPISLEIKESFVATTISYCIPEVTTEVINMVKLPE